MIPSPHNPPQLSHADITAAVTPKRCCPNCRNDGQRPASDVPPPPTAVRSECLQAFQGIAIPGLILLITQGLLLNSLSFSSAGSCCQGISGGREARHAKAGDVLIFRGQQGGQGSDAVGVAHRSPDMVEGQRRLVLTMDVGDIIAARSLS